MDNEQKNSYVKEQITNTLIQLLQDNELKDLSITMITETAQVNRVSFYRNYSSKEDIIREYIHHLLHTWQRGYDETFKRDKDIKALFKSLFQHFAENKELYLLMYKRNLSSLVLDSIKQICGPNPSLPDNIAYFAGFMSCGIFGWIDEWFARGMKTSPEEMIQLLKLWINNIESYDIMSTH